MQRGSTSHQLQMELLGDTSETTNFAAEWSYTASRPLEVTVTFSAQPEPVTWTFSRELLADGLREPTGHGDIVVWPEHADDSEPPWCRIWLRTPAGDAELRASIADLDRFLAATWQIVPAGAEYNHWMSTRSSNGCSPSTVGQGAWSMALTGRAFRLSIVARLGCGLFQHHTPRDHRILLQHVEETIASPAQQ